MAMKVLLNRSRRGRPSEEIKQDPGTPTHTKYKISRETLHERRHSDKGRATRILNVLVPGKTAGGEPAAVSDS
jgi:hypothetical protein